VTGCDPSRHTIDVIPPAARALARAAVRVGDARPNRGGSFRVVSGRGWIQAYLAAMGREATSRASTFSCVKREALLQDDRRKRHFVDCLRRAVEESTVEMHAWVVMRNHVHLLWTPRDECADAWLTRLKRRFVETLPDWPASGGGQFWQRGGGYDRIVWSQEEWSRQLRYIEANPVRAGLVDSAERYPWCSAHDWRVAQRDWTPKLAAAPEGLVSLWWY